MLLKALVDEDFVNYKITSMFIGCHSCTFKCDIMAGKQVCQNGALANQPNLDVSIDNIVDRYLKNPLSKAIVFGGLEPFDDILNVLSVIETLRHKGNNDDVVIYTGYTESEIENLFTDLYNTLKGFPNIIIKFGRFMPDMPSHIDPILGVQLMGDNQYAKRIS